VKGQDQVQSLPVEWAGIFNHLTRNNFKGKNSDMNLRSAKQENKVKESRGGGKGKILKNDGKIKAAGRTIKFTLA